MTVKDVANVVEELAPLGYQESYDNSGLSVGSPSMEVTGILLCFDVTEKVVAEAVELGANLIISHHPVIFSGLKSITGRSAVERIVLKAIRHNIALYAAHTNLDSVPGGINDRLCDILGLQKRQVLSPLKGQLVKIVTFVPHEQASKVRQAMFAAGAGGIGCYDCCSFSSDGSGSFRASEGANPFVGEVGQLHFEAEARIEVICPRILINGAVEAMVEAHPYEEVAYDIIPIENDYQKVGIGMVGELEEPLEVSNFLEMVKEKLGCSVLRFSNPQKSHIKKVAVCGGSGASFASLAIAKGADALVTGDVKYHSFLDYQEKLLLVDAGHFETEQFAIGVFYDFIREKIANFAVYKTKQVDNPVNYLYR
jgi:dinuclear metal center YbgI/SA1388 family protein